MNIFGQYGKTKLSPECPCCKNEYSNLIAQGKDWKEWNCLKCRRVFVIKKDGEIQIRGKVNGK